MILWLQTSTGGFAYDSTAVAAGNEAVQETAYAILALNAMGGYGDEIAAAIAYLESVQLCSGGFEQAPGEGENNEISAEGLWGLSIGNLLELIADDPSLYVQTGENVVIDMDISNLLQKVNGCQAILNFSSTYFLTGGLDVTVAPGGGVWDLVIWNVWDVGGDLDMAIGVDADGDIGTDADGTVAVVTLTAGATEGTTQVVFRDDVDDIESTWLTDMTAQAVIPNKVNSQQIVIDGTDPALTDLTATEDQDVPDVDVLNGANVTLQGTVEITADVSDGLAGLADVPSITLTHTDGVTTLTATLVDSEGPVYGWEAGVDSTTKNGQYNIVVSATDNSGNTNSISGYIIVNKNEISGQVELEDFVGSSRDVTFVATGGTIKTWTLTLSFTGTVAGYELQDVPEGTTALSAKTAWNLRSKVASVLDGNGQAANVDFTGTGAGTEPMVGGKLRGGDLNGTNTVNILDYGLLKINWYQPNTLADINGSGGNEGNDYRIMKRNWFTRGDEQ